MTLEPSLQDRRTAAAMAEALARWHLLDFGAEGAPAVSVRCKLDGRVLTPTRYSPCLRNVHYVTDDGAAGWMRRRVFFAIYWPRTTR